jgi:UDP-galactopyranose mutase
MSTTKYDYLIVGSGLFGAVFANQLTKNGKSCLIIDKRKKLGGNARTDEVEGIHVHSYGPHIFHCNDDRIWNFVNSHSKFNSFVNRPKVYYKGKIYSFPINLMTLYQMWGVKNPEEAQKKIDSVKINIDNPSNLEEWILSQVGEEIYQTFVYGYTKKQWGRDPKNLPSFIIKRLPIRLNFDDNYYTDKYQGIPIGGYTKMIENIIGDVPVELEVDFLSDREYLSKKANKVVYTGMIDRYFDDCYGSLEYRGLKFETDILDCKDYQGNALINFTEENIPYTRICEHKHFDFGKQDKTVVTKEYPSSWKPGDEAYYPVNDEKNNNVYSMYKKLSLQEQNTIFGGRLADYKYYDMHQVIGSALVRSKAEIEK